MYMCIYMHVDVHIHIYIFIKYKLLFCKFCLIIYYLSLSMLMHIFYDIVEFLSFDYNHENYYKDAEVLRRKEHSLLDHSDIIFNV